MLDSNDESYEACYLARTEKCAKIEEKEEEKEKPKEEENSASNIGKSVTATGNLKIGGATKAKGGYRYIGD